MEDFWQILRGWTPIGQGFFLLCIFGSFVALIYAAIHYITVLLRGWPPPNTPMPFDEDDDE